MEQGGAGRGVLQVAPESSGPRTLPGGVTPIEVALGVDEALSLLQAWRPEAVIVENVTDGQNGFAVCATIRARHPDLPILVIGGANRAEVWREAVDSGATAYEPDGSSESRVVDAIDRLRRQAAAKSPWNLFGALLDAMPFPVLLADVAGEIRYVSHMGRTLFPSVAGTGPNPRTKVAGLFGSALNWTSKRLMEIFVGATANRRPWNGTVRWRSANGTEAWFELSLSPVSPFGDDGLPCSLLVFTPAGAVIEWKESARREKAAFEGLADLHRRTLSALRRESSRSDASPGDPLPNAVRKAAALADGLSGPIAATRAPVPVADILRDAALDAFEGVDGGGELRIDAPANLDDGVIGPDAAVKAVIAALLRFASRSVRPSAIRLSATLRGKTGRNAFIRFAVHATDQTTPGDGYLEADRFLYGVTDPDAIRSLSLASRLAEKAGCRIMVREEAGRGRAASFSVPFELAGETAIATPAPETVRSASPDAPPRNLKVLVAEDDPVMRTSLQRKLESMGHGVVAVTDGREAVEESEHADYDLVLMDILMPEMDGFEATRLIRERDRFEGRRIPIVALTAYSLKAVRDKAVAAGMDGFLSKPPTQADIERVLGEVALAPPSSEPGAEPSAKAPEAGAPDATRTLDLKYAASFIDGDLSLLKELVDLFVVHGKASFDDMVSAARALDPEALDRSAHKMKGMASNVGAVAMVAFCESVRETCAAGRLPVRKAAELERALVGRYRDLEEAIAAIDWSAPL